MQLDDLGVQARGDAWLTFRSARHPGLQYEVGLGSLARGGFMVIDPVERRGTQVLPAETLSMTSEGWAIAQAPDGAVWQGCYSRRAPLMRWNWNGMRSELVARLPLDALFSLDVAPDGRVYLPFYSANRLYCFDPKSGCFEELATLDAFGKFTRNVACASDGWVYVTTTDYPRSLIVAFDPQSGQCQPLGAEKGQDGPPFTHLFKDGAGRVLTMRTQYGWTLWFELVGGRARPIAAADGYGVELLSH